MTSQLDEYKRLVIQAMLHGLTEEEANKKESLKSQIESKLAQADNPSMCPICQGRGFVSEGFYSTTTGQWSSTSTLTEKCRSCNGLGIIQNSNQELSQLREEIKKKDYEASVYCKSTEKLAIDVLHLESELKQLREENEKLEGDLKRARHRYEDDETELFQLRPIVQAIRDEILECQKKDYRYEIPVGWNNYPITDTIINILSSILTNCTHEKSFSDGREICKDCRIKLKSILASKSESKVGN